MSDIQTQNATIESTTLSIADHGVLSSFIHLKYGGGSGQGFGGYALCTVPWEKTVANFHLTIGPNFAGVWIVRVLQIAGVTEWKALPGRTIRVRGDRTKILSIGHIIEDDWFDPRQVFEEMN